MRKTVLIVDDSPAVIDALTGAFEEAGYEVASAADGDAVFKRLTGVNPDVLLLDIFIPKLNGADVCRLVKAHPHWKKTYLVLMSSRIGDSEIDTYKKIGADQVLKKPLDAPAVVQLVSSALAS
jgi:CheY-like chemotaxis protein